MEIIKETKYLIFKITEEKPKTKVISVINKHINDEIATIEWYPQWRQYTFTPGYGTTWNDTCLLDVISVLNQLMDEKKGKYNNKANNGK